MIVRYLGGCMLGHSVVAGALLSMPSKQIKNDDLRQLKYNLLNAQQFESEGTAGQAGGSGGATAGSRGFTGGAGRMPPPSAEQQQASGGRVYDQGDSGSRVSSGRQGFAQ